MLPGRSLLLDNLVIKAPLLSKLKHTSLLLATASPNQTLRFSFCSPLLIWSHLTPHLSHRVLLEGRGLLNLLLSLASQRILSTQ